MNIIHGVSTMPDRTSATEPIVDFAISHQALQIKVNLIKTFPVMFWFVLDVSHS